MTRTQVLQELRRMRFAEAYGGWQERRLSQEEAETRLDVKVPARECISVPGRLGKFSSVPMGDELEDASTRLGERRGSSERSEPVGVRPGSDVEEFGHDADRVVDPGGVDVEVGDHAIRIPDPDEHPVSLAVRGEGFEPVRSQLREDHVGLNGIVIDVDAVDTGEAVGKPPGVGVIGFEPIHVVVEGVYPRRRDEPDLAHPAADDLAPPPRPRDELPRANEEGAGRGAESLGQADRHAVE